jgi:UDP-N-acetylglucosamine--N-acetylmuramyl-(pentapeptide) pyrophosphoryl-undecaprenol N-acetylglucosamine transferase
MAHLLGIKTAVAEQNALPGLANRILGKFVDRIFLTYRETKRWFPRQSTLVTGNPVRADFMPGTAAATERGGSFTILVFGGSQGARAINRAVLGALPHLCAEGLSMRIIHQTGQDDREYVAGVYQTYGIEAEVLPFIRDMSVAYRAADLVICRAGATSLAEITVLGKAAILIPFPFAVDDHQSKNALVMVRAGAAVMIEEKGLAGAEMAETIITFYRNRDLLRDMEGKSAALGNIRAAADIVDNCLTLL